MDAVGRRTCTHKWSALLSVLISTLRGNERAARTEQDDVVDGLQQTEAVPCSTTTNESEQSPVICVHA